MCRKYYISGLTSLTTAEEVCKIFEGQRYSKRLHERQIIVLLKVTCQCPRDRERDIIKVAAHVQHVGGGPFTNFLVLDKCLPGCNFLQIIEIESESRPYGIQYGDEWLATTRRLELYLPTDQSKGNFWKHGSQYARLSSMVQN